MTVDEVTPPDELIVPALELAVLVARVLTQMRPPVPVPKRIRSLARFTKLPVSARPCPHHRQTTSSTCSASVSRSSIRRSPATV